MWPFGRKLQENYQAQGINMQFNWYTLNPHWNGIYMWWVAIPNIPTFIWPSI